MSNENDPKTTKESFLDSLKPKPLEAECGQIFYLIAKIKSEMPAIGKSEKNQAQNFMYRSVDAVYDVICPLSAKYGVTTTHEVLGFTKEIIQEGKYFHVFLKVRVHFHAPDGSFTSTDVIAESRDNWDKASTKAQTMVDKYAWIRILTIPVKQLESDQDGPPSINKKPRTTQQRKPAPPAMGSGGGKNSKPVTEKQINFLYVQAEKNGWNEGDIKLAIMKKWKYEYKKQMSMSDFDLLLKHIQANPKAPEPVESDFAPPEDADFEPPVEDDIPF